MVVAVVCPPSDETPGGAVWAFDAALNVAWTTHISVTAQSAGPLRLDGRGTLFVQFDDVLFVRVGVVPPASSRWPMAGAESGNTRAARERP